MLNSFRDLFQSLKNTLRRLMPKWLTKTLVFIWRRLRAVIAATMFGFPGKKLRIIGVTGTDGKTTTSNYLGSILQAGGNKVAISSTAIFQIGNERWLNKTNFTADYTFQLQKFLAKAKKANVDYVVLEVTAHGLDQYRGLWGFNYLATVMTNLTQDHLDYFKTMQNYAKAKGKLFASHPDFIVLNKDDEWFEFFDKFPAMKLKTNYGTDAEADNQIIDIEETVRGNSFTLMAKDRRLNLRTNLVGRFNVFNASAAATTALALGVPESAVVKGVADLDRVPGRMDTIVTKPFTVIVDYAHTPGALTSLLTALKQRYDTSKLILVFGATGDRDKGKRPIMGEIVARLADLAIITDDEPYSENPALIRDQVYRGVSKALRGKVKAVAGRREAIAEAFIAAKDGDVVVLTGMGHQSYMVTNEGKIAWNDAEVAKEELAKLKQNS